MTPMLGPLLQTDDVTHSSLYTEQLLCAHALTRRGLYTEKLLHTGWKSALFGRTCTVAVPTFRVPLPKFQIPHRDLDDAQPFPAGVPMSSIASG